MSTKEKKMGYMDLDGKPIIIHSDKGIIDSVTIGDSIFRTPLKLNMGSGFRKEPYFINVDNRKETTPDLLWDVNDGLPFPDNSVDWVRAHDFLEHIPIGKTIAFVEEVYRVLKNDGIFDTFTPSTAGYGAFQDPTHVSFWNPNSWLYYVLPDYRALYNIKAHFSIEVLQEVATDQFRNIIHTVGKFHAVKEQVAEGVIDGDK